MPPARRLMMALIQNVSFEGVTGRVQFNDASSHPARRYNGDRTVGVRYEVRNHAGSAGLTTVGTWRPCTDQDEVCDFSTRWEANSEQALTYSTADNSRPFDGAEIGLLLRLTDAQHQLALDDGSCLVVQVSLDPKRQRLRLDFSGTSPQRPGNFNAPLAVTRAAVLYVIRCLLDSDIPLNEGCFAPLDLVVPEGCLLNPRPPAAVVAGNVEVSQALCNLLFAAFGAQAAGQGTMNNVSFGNGRCQYYETVAGGGGAGEGFAGSVGLQSHMTNSRLTDPEVLESRYPVRLESFAVRSGSGGQGRWPGGDGLERTIRFLEPMSVSLISGSRQVAPFGLNGGASGACGENLRLDREGVTHPLPGAVQLELQAGEAIRMLTPGGGGMGR